MPTADSTGIAIDVAELGGIVAEGILYGAFTVFFGVAMRILTGRRRHGGKTNIPMLVAALLMMTLATAQIIVDTVNIFWAFIDKEPRLARQFFLENATEPIFAAKHSIYFTMMLLGDSIVIYRCFVVWSNNYWVVLVPILCSLGSGVCAYQTIWAVRHIQSATISAETKWGIAVLALSMSANIIATSLLAYRIWNSERQLSKSMGQTSGYKFSSGANHRRVVRIVLESGLVNTAYLIAYTAVLVIGNTGLEVMAGISTPLIGIIFTVVIIRAATSSDVVPSTQQLPFSARNISTNRYNGRSDIQITVDSTIVNDDSMEMKGRFQKSSVSD
ncbi:hypothetical protein FB451DRAFT_1263676 [Mycena latifolia]|nr:hypothetical protein FB451DRAFT_1263676 [Mycena latifolia]